MANQACSADSAIGAKTPANSLKVDRANGITASASVWRIAEGLQLRPVADAPTDDPLWVVQTDKYVLPNHGFMAQKPFWCFIDGALSLTASRG
jgi:hypothetical protein